MQNQVIRNNKTKTFMAAENIVEDKKLKNYILIISIALFVLSLTQKCYCTTTACSDSIMAFLLGWAAILSGAGFSWIANPLLLVAWITLKKRLKLSMFLSMFAALLSLLFLLFDSVPDNENGGSHQIVSYGLGYWLWIGSTITMLVGTYALMLRYNTRRRQQRIDAAQQTYTH